MRFALVICSLVVAGPLAAQDAGDIATAIVPVVGSVLGENHVTWRTDLELVNDSGVEVIVALEPIGYDDRMIVESIEPGGVRRYPDLAGAAFGLEGVLVPLAVRT